MRFFEFAETDVNLDKFVIILKNFVGRSASKKQSAKLNWRSLQQIANRSGFEMGADYDTFKSIYDSSPIVQSLVKNFNADGIELNVPGTDKDTQTPISQGQSSQDAVDKIAAGAAAQNLA